MTQEERVHSVMDVGFTERQARFLVLVLRHAGVCIPRQYASFAGITNGARRCNAFCLHHAGEHRCHGQHNVGPAPYPALARARQRRHALGGTAGAGSAGGLGS